MSNSLARAIKALDGLGQGINEHTNYAVGGFSKAMAGFNQKAAKHISSTDSKPLEHHGEGLQKPIGATTDDVRKAPLVAEAEVCKCEKPATEGARKAADGFGKEGENPGGAGEDPKKSGWRSVAGGIKTWAGENPVKSASIVAGIIAPPVAIAALPAVLGGIGFTAGGVVGGMFLTYPLSLELIHLKSQDLWPPAPKQALGTSSLVVCLPHSRVLQLAVRVLDSSVLSVELRPGWVLVWVLVWLLVRTI